MKNKGAIFFSGLILILTILLAIPTYRYTKKVLNKWLGVIIRSCRR